MATSISAVMLSHEVGESIPPHTAHVGCLLCIPITSLANTFIFEKAVSVSLPTWKANVGYEEGEDWVLSKMKTGYPRSAIQACHLNSLS